MIFFFAAAAAATFSAEDAVSTSTLVTFKRTESTEMEPSLRTWEGIIGWLLLVVLVGCEKKVVVVERMGREGEKGSVKSIALQFTRNPTKAEQRH